MPSADATQQMIEDEIAPINLQLEQLDYELDSRIDSLQTQVDGRIDVVADHVTQLDGWRSILKVLKTSDRRS